MGIGSDVPNLQQQLSIFGVACASCHNASGRALVSQQAVSTSFQQQLCNLRVAVVNCQCEGCSAFRILQILASTRLQQQLCNLHVVVASCCHQSCRALVILHVHLSTSAQQQLRHLRAALASCHYEVCCALVILQVTCWQQQLCDLCGAFVSCLHESCPVVFVRQDLKARACSSHCKISIWPRPLLAAIRAVLPELSCNSLSAPACSSNCAVWPLRADAIRAAVPSLSRKFLAAQHLCHLRAAVACCDYLGRSALRILQVLVSTGLQQQLCNLRVVIASCPSRHKSCRALVILQVLSAPACSRNCATFVRPSLAATTRAL